MRILHVLTSPRAEGTPRLALDWLNIKEYEQHVLFLNSSPPDLLNQFQEATSFIRINEKLKNKIFYRLFKIPKLVKKTCKQIKPDIVIAWNQPNVHLILAGAKLAGVRKLIGHAGCLPEKSAKIGWFYTYFVFYPIVLMKAKVICPSSHICGTFYKIPCFPKSTLKVVPNAINIERFIKKDKTFSVIKNTAIYVANLEYAKDHEVLIKAWALVIEEFPNAMLFLAGRGSLETKLKEICMKLNCNDNIVFLGTRNDIPELLWQTELFVFPSRNVEGFGTVLLEALAAGLKIVSFDEPAPREVLDNGQYGYLVKKREPRSLADAIIFSFNTSPNEEYPINYIKRYSIENMVHQYIDIANM